MTKQSNIGAILIQTTRLGKLEKIILGANVPLYK